MNKKYFFKTVLGYLRHNLKALSLFIVFSGIFTVIFYLYNAEIAPTKYAILICAFVGFVFVCFDFYFFYRKHLELVRMKNKVIISKDELSKVSDLIENDYYELLCAVHDDKMKLISGYDIGKKEMIDYYTLWVHQIKTPISAMRLLLQAEDSSQTLELTSELFKIEQYVEMVLTYLRLGSNSSDFVIKKYPLDKIVRDAVHKYAPMFIRKKVALEYSHLDLEVLTDEKWLTFVVEQILSNSLKYTSSGKISIYTKEQLLIIHDTGIGIAPEDLPRIFDNGFTGYNGRSDKKATGIGLYLSKQILEKLSHSIEITSEPGVGTTVIINLESVNIIIV